MLPKRLSRLPMCQPMEARLTHPQLPIQLVSFWFFFYFGSLVFVFSFCSPPPPLISLLFSPFGYFHFLFSGFGWLTFVVFKKKKKEMGLVLGVVLSGYFIFFTFFPPLFSFFPLPLPRYVFRWKKRCDQTL